MLFNGSVAVGSAWFSHAWIMPMCHAGGLDVNIITSCAAGAHNCLTPLRSRLVNISYSISLPTFSHTAHHIHNIMALYKVRLGWTRLHLWHFFLFLSQTKVSIIAHVYMCLPTTSRIPYMAILVQPLHLAHFNRYCMFADIWPLCVFLVMPPWMMWPPNPMCCVDKHGLITVDRKTGMECCQCDN